MKEFTITTLVKECGIEELDASDRRLVDSAREATRSSYSPDSKFYVGAALQLADGSIVCGSNQENAAYPSGMCAERTALYYASATHPGVAIRKIAIAAWSKDGKEPDMPWEEYFQQMPISPCGACRQALLEYEVLYGKIEVLLYGKEKTYIFPSIGSLLPFSFTSF